MKIQRILQCMVSTTENREHWIVLAYTNRGEFVTWDYFDDTKYSGGHYFESFEEGYDDFILHYSPHGQAAQNTIKYSAKQIGQAEVIWENLDESTHQSWDGYSIPKECKDKECGKCSLNSAACKDIGCTVPTADILLIEEEKADVALEKASQMPKVELLQRESQVDIFLPTAIDLLGTVVQTMAANENYAGMLMIISAKGYTQEQLDRAIGFIKNKAAQWQE